MRIEASAISLFGLSTDLISPATVPIPAARGLVDVAVPGTKPSLLQAFIAQPPLKPSSVPLCQGLPGSFNAVWIALGLVRMSCSVVKVRCTST